MDLTHKDENTESTEERTIMMDSIKALHTGELRNEDSSDDSGYESVPGGEESLSGDGGPAEDEVTEEEYQEKANSDSVSTKSESDLDAGNNKETDKSKRKTELKRLKDHGIITEEEYLREIRRGE